MDSFLTSFVIMALLIRAVVLRVDLGSLHTVPLSHLYELQVVLTSWGLWRTTLFIFAGLFVQKFFSEGSKNLYIT